MVLCDFFGTQLHFMAKQERKSASKNVTVFQNLTVLATHPPADLAMRDVNPCAGALTPSVSSCKEYLNKVKYG